MIRKPAFLLGFVCLFTAASGQTTESQSVSATLTPENTQGNQVVDPNTRQAGRLSNLNPYLIAYRFAHSIQDGPSAQAHLSYYVANYSPAWAYQDTLMQCYFDYRNLVPCIRLAEKRLAVQPDHPLAHDLSAQSYQMLGQPKQALHHYEALYQIAPKPYILYQIAALQFELERDKECAESLETLLKSDLEGEELAIFEGQQAERVPMLAAVWNMRGSLSYRKKETSEARNAFQQALKIHPEFRLAQQNLAQITTGK